MVDNKLPGEEKIILFPLDKIKNKAQTGPKDTKYAAKIKLEQTKKFVEGEVDNIGMHLLKCFVDMGMKTQQQKFTSDFALVIDTLRGMIYRDFNVKHPAQLLADKMVTLNPNKSATVDYSKVMSEKFKPTKPINEDLMEDIKDTGEGFIDFDPDFDV
jgi:hypothetical protein